MISGLLSCNPALSSTNGQGKKKRHRSPELEARETMTLHGRPQGRHRARAANLLPIRKQAVIVALEVKTARPEISSDPLLDNRITFRATDEDCQRVASLLDRLGITCQGESKLCRQIFRMGLASLEKAVKEGLIR